MVLRCDINSLTQVQVSWIFVDGDVGNLEEMADDFSTPTRGSILNITRATLSHNGRYTCTATNLGGSETAEAQVTVLPSLVSTQASTSYPTTQTASTAIPSTQTASTAIPSTQTVSTAIPSTESLVTPSSSGLFVSVVMSMLETDLSLQIRLLLIPRSSFYLILSMRWLV